MQIWLRDQIWTILESWNQLFQHLCSAVGQAISQQKQKHCSPKLIQNIRVNHGLKFQILFNNICIVKQIISNALNISENSATRMGFEPWDEQEVSKVFGKCIRYDIHLFTLSYSTLCLYKWIHYGVMVSHRCCLIALGAFGDCHSWNVWVFLENYRTTSNLWFFQGGRPASHQWVLFGHTLMHIW